MFHTDEKWHTENFMGKMLDPEKGFLEQGDRREVEGDSRKCENAVS